MSTPARINAETKADIKEITAFVTKHGWLSLGCVVDDRLTIAAIIGEAVRMLRDKCREVTKLKGSENATPP